MKTKILIIEDNHCKFFTTKQVLETKLKLQVKIKSADFPEKFLHETQKFKRRNVIFKPKGGIIELLDIFEKKGVSRLNSEITLLLIDELPQNNSSSKSDLFAA